MTSVLDVDTRIRPLPFRRTFVGVETALAISGAVGALQLWEGSFVPPVSSVASLGLDSWRLPAVWLFSSVAVPSAVAAVAAARRWRGTPTAVLVASGLLLVEVTVQVPFVGPSVLQAAFGGAAVAMGSLALVARRSGMWAGGGERP